MPGVFPGGKGGWCVRLTTLPPSCTVVMKSGNLKFLEHSGPLQAGNGTALPLPLLQLSKKIGGRLVKGAEKLVAFRRHSTSSFSTGNLKVDSHRVFWLKCVIPDKTVTFNMVCRA